MRILGIDPGMRVTGYGVIDAEGLSLTLIEAGIIDSVKENGIAARLACIQGGVRSIVKDFGPDVMVLERLYTHYRHPTTALLMGHARGVICEVSGESQVPLVSLAPTRVKKSIVSNGHASKLQVQRAVQGLLRLKRPPNPFDVSDALAVAISYAFGEGRLQARGISLK